MIDEKAQYKSLRSTAAFTITLIVCAQLVSNFAILASVLHVLLGQVVLGISRTGDKISLYTFAFVLIIGCNIILLIGAIFNINKLYIKSDVTNSDDGATKNLVRVQKLNNVALVITSITVIVYTIILLMRFFFLFP